MQEKRVPQMRHAANPIADWRGVYAAANWHYASPVFCSIIGLWPVGHPAVPTREKAEDVVFYLDGHSGRLGRFIYVFTPSAWVLR